MPSIRFLNKIRDFEIQKIIKYFPQNAIILEIGGGTGCQAKIISEHGFHIKSIDISSSIYKDNQEFPVIEYNGEKIPFDNATFDVVFSSNVLEHIPDLKSLHQEIKRVLKPNGFCIHVLPSGSWRFWTNMVHYISCLKKISLILISSFSAKKIVQESITSYSEPTISATKNNLLIPSHGGKHNAILEMLTFSRYYWIPHFKKNNLLIEGIRPMGLFYTGHLIFADNISVAWRESLAKLLGSSCLLYKVRYK